MSVSRENIDTLTGLRGFAALWVVLFHTCFGAPNGYLPGLSEKLDWGILRNVIVQGVYAVDIFFVLSGFILTYVHGKEFEGALKVRDMAHFFALRLARIYPVHLVTVLLLSGVYVFGMWGPKTISWEEVWLSVFLMNMWSDPSINTPAWSVSAEWFAYLGFPVLIPLLMHVKGVSGKCLGILLLSTGYPLCVMAYDWGWDWHFGWVALFRVVNGFCLGCLLYYVQEHISSIQDSSWSSKWCAGILGLLVVLLVLGYSIIFIYPLIPWFILTLAHAQGGVARVFANKGAVFLGTISFGIYMVHYPVLEFVRYYLNDFYANLDGTLHQALLLFHVGGILALVIVVARSCYLWIEYPSRTYLKQRIRHWNATYHPECVQTGSTR